MTASSPGRGGSGDGPQGSGIRRNGPCGLCQATVLPAVLGGTRAAEWTGWTVLFGGLGVAVVLLVRGDRLAWWLAGGSALVLLDLSLLTQLARLPGQVARDGGVAAVGASAAAALVLLLWLAAGRGAGLLLVRSGVAASAALAVLVLLPLGGGPASEVPDQAPSVTVAHPEQVAHPEHQPDHADPASAAPVRAAASASSSAGDAAPLRPASLQEQLDATRAAAAEFPTLGDALADGWTLADDYITDVGAHYMRYARIDSVFDPARPEMLLFAGDRPDSPVVGVTYYVVHREPAGFTGDQDVWHQHENVCIASDGPRFAGDGATGCKARWDWAWMLHAWVVPNWEAPGGVFAADNPLV